MKLSTIVVLAAVSVARVSSAQTVVAQTVSPQTVDESAPLNTIPAGAAAVDAATSSSETTPFQAKSFQPVTPSLFRSMGHDVTNFFSTDTAKVLGVFALGGLTVRPFDHASVEDTSERLSKGFANIGNVGGGLYAQAGGALATYVIGRATGNQRLALVGGDLLRAQALSELFVQTTKFAVRRQRPDASDSLSFPSGHTSTAFATATVLQQHFGWKIGVPAYSFAAFVGASRMASSKHYFSDVVMGAGIGVAVGRTVTLHVGQQRFALGAAPTQGGAMVTFTKR